MNSGLVSKLCSHYITGFLGKDRTHEARVTATLDIAHYLDNVLVLLDNVMTGHLRLLRTENILDILQFEASLSLVDVKTDQSTQCGPAVVGGQPGGKNTLLVS